MSKTVVALVPHPDDAEYHAGGLLANFVAVGARVYIVIATDGRCGSFEHHGGELARLRADEARRAAIVLGAEPPILLGYPDFEVDKAPPGELREKFIRILREIKPDITISEDPFVAAEIHPDHRAVAWAAHDAVQFAQLPLVIPQHALNGLQPHYVTEKYYWTERSTQANKVVDITTTIDRKLAALAEHASQVKFLVEDIFRQANLAGLDLAATLGPASSDPLAALTWFMHTQAAEIGEQAGYRCAELYRYERFHPIVESFLS